MGIFSDAFEPVWSEAIYKAGWEWNSVNNWWELPIYNVNCQSDIYCGRSLTVLPSVVLARLRNVPYRPEKSDTLVLDFVHPHPVYGSYIYQIIYYSRSVTEMYVTDMGELQCKLAQIVKLIQEEWKIPEQYFNYNI